MIKLEVAEYCASCPEFEPDVERKEGYVTEVIDLNDRGFRFLNVCDTYVRCLHADRCAGIQRYLEDERTIKNDKT